jgi:hypothetical protein
VKVEEQRREVDLKKLTPAQARVEIAKDVIAQVEARQLLAAHGVYFLPGGEPTQADFDFIRSGARDMKGLLEELRASRKPCRVCAVGACLAAVVARENDFTVGDCATILDQATRLKRRLSPYFPEGMLALMEAAFEGRYQQPLVRVLENRAAVPTPNQYVEAIEFGRGADPDGGAPRRPDMEESIGAARRLLAIMRNIVENGGEFRPAAGSS